MESTRLQKISRLIQKELGIFFQREGQKICRGKMVTVSSVNITPDLGLARVYLSIYPSNQGDDDLLKIKGHNKAIRNYLGHEVRHQLRIVPELEFIIDDSLDYISHIDDLLKK
jgi:ribosome-binding factor A